MGDLFFYGKSISVEEYHLKQAEIFKIMKCASHHIYLILTKRPENMAWWAERWIGWWGEIPENWWLGVSIEDQKTADERIPILLQIPAVKRFVSVEPMLGEIDISFYLNGCPQKIRDEERVTHEMAIDAGDKNLEGTLFQSEEWEQTCPSLDWIVCGGETGPCARPLHPDWVRSLRDQCQAAGVPFFFKSWGDHKKQYNKSFNYDSTNDGYLLDGKEYREVPE